MNVIKYLASPKGYSFVHDILQKIYMGDPEPPLALQPDLALHSLEKTTFPDTRVHGRRTTKVFPPHA